MRTFSKHSRASNPKMRTVATPRRSEPVIYIVDTDARGRRTVSLCSVLISGRDPGKYSYPGYRAYPVVTVEYSEN